MKSIRTEAYPIKEITYPCLMQAKSGNIILFHTSNSGTLVYKHIQNDINSKYPIGYYETEVSIENFTPFKGFITLTNE